MPPREATEDEPLLKEQRAAAAAASSDAPDSLSSEKAKERWQDAGSKAQEHAAAARANVEAAQEQLKQGQEAVDRKVEIMVERLGVEKYLEKVIQRKQADNLYPTTLLWARVTKAGLAFFVVVCSIALLTGFLFQGSLELLEEINQVDELEAPMVMLCAQPWGTKFAVRPHVQTASLVSIPSGESYPLLERHLGDFGYHVGNFTHIPCPASTSFCHCLDFTTVMLRPKKGQRAAQYDQWPYLKLEFHAANGGDPAGLQYAFGFYAKDGVLPQTWSYAALGSSTQGDIQAEEVATGKTEFTDGEPCPRFDFRRTGEAPNNHADGRTVLMFGYDVFLLYVVAAVGSKWSVFSLITLMLMFCAAINNFGLFDIMFPDALDKENPKQLFPNPILATICGPCFMCCLPKSSVLEKKSRRKAAPGEEPEQVTVDDV